MEIQKNLLLGYADPKFSPQFHGIIDNKLITYYSRKNFIHGRVLLALGQYLEHTNKFGRIFACITNQPPGIFPNGTLRGILGMVNRSELDIDVTQVFCNEFTMETVDFSYPYKISDFTFVTFKPEYKPHIFGIFQTFSLNV